MLVSKHISKVIAKMDLYKSSVSHRSFGRYFDKLWGSKDLAELSDEDIALWSLRRRKEVAAATVKAESSFLRAVFRDAKRPWPTDEIPRIKLNNQRLFVFEPKHESQIKALLKPMDWTIFRFLVVTGLRRLELFRLRACDFDLRRGQESMHITTSKTGEGRRNPLYPEAVKLITPYIKRCEDPKQYLFFPRASNRSSAAQTWSYNVMRPVLNTVVGSDFQLRDSRHTFCSRLADSDVHPTVIRDLAGHSSLTMTNRYLQTSDKRRRSSLKGAKL